MICQYCRDEIFRSNKTWGLHQPSYTDVGETEAVESCDFCSALGPSSASDKPLYRWSIQKPGRFRECNDYITVIFRPIDCGTEPGVTALPTRIFQLIQQNHIHVVSNLSLETNSNQSWEQVKTWIEDCSTNHPRCTNLPRSRKHQQSEESEAESETKSPSRLIDVRGHRQVLVSTSELGFIPPYVTLSHCWGGAPNATAVASDSNSDSNSKSNSKYSDVQSGPQPNSVSTSEPAPASTTVFKLTTHNKTRLMDPTCRISWGELPLNFQDAITIARKINVDYIWIDALCIVQDNGEFKDEGQFMHVVYRRSFCNIAAADASNCRGGLFAQRPPAQVVPGVVSGGGAGMLGDKSWYILRKDVWSTNLLKRVLYTRGWVFQERMLSPRILHYSHREIFWDCAEMSASETLPRGLPDPIDFSAATDRHWRERLRLTQEHTRTISHIGTADVSFHKFWKSSVEHYTGCNLSVATDRLLAIWGVAKVVREELGEPYAHGLWEFKLYRQLAWQVVAWNGDGKHPTTVEERLQLAPSWSWTSMNAAIKLQDRLDPLQKTTPRHAKNHAGEEMRFQFHEPQPDVKGATQPVLKSRRIAVREKLIPAVLVDEGEYLASLRQGSRRIQGFLDTPGVEGHDCYLLVLVAYTRTDERENTAFFDGLGLVLYEYTGFSFDFESESESESGGYRHYRRGGMFRFSEFDQTDYDKLDAARDSMEKFWVV